MRNDNNYKKKHYENKKSVTISIKYTLNATHKNFLTHSRNNTHHTKNPWKQLNSILKRNFLKFLILFIYFYPLLEVCMLS